MTATPRDSKRAARLSSYDLTRDDFTQRPSAAQTTQIPDHDSSAYAHELAEIEHDFRLTLRDGLDDC